MSDDRLGAAALDGVTFACARCGKRTRVLALPVVRAYRSRHTALADATSERGRSDPASVQRTLGIVRCPACKRRPAGALVPSILRVATITTVTTIAAATGGGSLFWIGTLTGLVIMVPLELVRLRGIDAGTMFDEPPPAALPEARVRP
ncbi:MAG TPA: hypothetical protein VLX92_20320 [Kofleriaceae bacterium]|nr:hypothetical protein [Kofleriaceae bacterium]